MLSLGYEAGLFLELRRMYRIPQFRWIGKHQYGASTMNATRLTRPASETSVARRQSALEP
jgi:hypothetical protein